MAGPTFNTHLHGWKSVPPAEEHDGGHRRLAGRIHVGLHQNIADMNLLLRPYLHVLDATRIMLQNGPSGGSLEDVAVKNLVFAGTDPVALDALGTGLFGMKPADIGYITKAHQAGRGKWT